VPRAPGRLVGRPGVGRRIYSGFGASLGERDMFRGLQARGYFFLTILFCSLPSQDDYFQVW
jgi:hypothetical protein